MKKQLSILFLLVFQLIWAQPNDCVNAIVVCGNGNFSSNAVGPGNTQEILNYCSGAEHNSLWIKVNIVRTGTLGFTITPNSPDIEVDYDFWVFGPNKACGALGAPIRCNTTNPAAAGLTSNITGMTGTAVTTQSGPGANGNGFVRWIDVVAGQFYYIAIDRPVGDGGFSIEWTGSATEGGGAFDSKPVAHDVVYPQCSETEQAIFNLNSIKSQITDNVFNNSVTYFTTFNNAVDNINRITNNVYGNSTNPEVLYARVQNTATGCFEVSEVTLRATALPTATLQAEPTVCAGESYSFTITGTPNAKVSYKILGTSYTAILDATGTITVTNNYNSNFSIELESIQVINQAQQPVCTTVLNSVVNVVVYERPTISIGSILNACLGQPVGYTFTGTPNTEVIYQINGSNFTASIPNSGTLQVTHDSALFGAGNHTIRIVEIRGNSGLCTFTGTETASLSVYETPNLNIIPELKGCVANANDPYVFDLVSYINTQQANNIQLSIHENEADAQTNTNALTSYSLLNATATLYVRIGYDGVSCHTIKPLTLVKNVTPSLPNFTDVAVCDQYILPALSVGNYYTQPNKGGNLLAAGTTLNTSQTVYVYAENVNDTSCFVEKSFVVTVTTTPQLASFSPVTACGSYTLPAIAVGKYYPQPNGLGGEILSGTEITENQTVYVFAQNGACIAQSSFTVSIIDIPTINSEISYSVCDTDFDGIAPINLNNFTSEILNGLTPSSFQITFYNSLNDAELERNAITNTAAYTSTMAHSYRVYALVKNNGTTNGCSALATIDIEIKALPRLATFANINACGSYTLPSLEVGTYYNLPNAQGGTLAAGTVIQSSRTIYVYAANGMCTVENQFTVSIVDAPTVAANTLIEICDIDSDGIIETDLTQYQSQIVNNTDPLNYTFKYYVSLSDAQNQTNAISSPEYYVNNTPNLFTVYVRVVHAGVTDGCGTIAKLTIRVHPTAKLKAQNGFICVDAITGTLQNPYVITVQNQSPGTFIYHWYYEGEEITGITGSTYTATQAGLYTVYAENTTSGCNSSIPIEIEVGITSAAIFDQAIVTNGFTANQTIEIVLAGGLGNYEYSIDGINYQDSPVFKHLLATTYTIYIRDKNKGGCDIITRSVNTLTFRNFFTPNGDGIYDTWNIEALAHQPEAVIMIYDRYGKLLTQIYPSKQGWDGTINGKGLPSTDYWFKVYYLVNDKQVEYNSHFSLVR